MTTFDLIEAAPQPSPARTAPPERGSVRVGAVQTSWHSDAHAHRAILSEGVRLAAARGARIVCLQELTLAPYFATRPDRGDEAREYAESIPGGATTTLAVDLARETGAAIHASLYENAGPSGRYNTAICAAPDGTLLARTRKMHIPRFPGYHEDRYFDAGDSGFPVADIGGAMFGFPTCWDQWFPELARCYALRGADAIVYPTAIGSEPEIADFDTQPLWEQMIRANGLANATFMIAVNRIGCEDGIRFYGSSFMSDPYGRVLVRAPRERDAVIVADLDLDQRRDWLNFGLLATRRPSEYGPLLEEHP